MQIEMKTIKIRDIVDGYEDNEEDGVVGYSGKLNIRPAYQREFVYKEKQRDEVIRTVRKKFPLNVFYWSKSDDGTFEMLDGQQRTLSICQYVDGDFSIDNKYFHSLTGAEQNEFLDYPLMVYVCEGSESEKLDWFEIINIAGEELTPQELRNAAYTGKWLYDAKKYFSKTGCTAFKLGEKYMTGSPIRQEYLEKVLSWIIARDNIINIREYMSLHQHDPNALPLKTYFASIIEWVETVFPNYRREMKGIEWGLLYNEYGTKPLDAVELEKEISRLMQDDDVTAKKGIYSYVLSGDERYLNIRKFTDTQKRAAYERQNGICPNCGNRFDYEEMHGDHITPWHAGGKTEPDNLQMLCAECNRRKSGI